MGRRHRQAGRVGQGASRPLFVEPSRAELGADALHSVCTDEQDYKEYHTDKTVHFVVTLTAEGKKQVDSEGLEKVFKVVSKVNTSNMVCFDPQGKIKKYATPEDIVADFYDVRLEYYHKRKKHLVGELELVHERLSNQARFIQLIISRELVVSNRKRADVVAELRKRNFRPFPKVAKAHVAGRRRRGGAPRRRGGRRRSAGRRLGLRLLAGYGHLQPDGREGGAPARGARRAPGGARGAPAALGAGPVARRP